MIEIIIDQLGPYLQDVLALVVGWFAVRLSGKIAGRTEAKIDQLEANALAREKAREMDNKRAALDDDAIRRRAKQWLRDDGK